MIPAPSYLPSKINDLTKPPPSHIMVGMSVNTWSTRMSALKKYVEEHGDAQVPVKYVASLNGKGDIYLGTWVSYLRTRYKHNKLSEEKIAALEALPGWKWSLQPGPQRDEERDEEILRLREEGNTLQAIGDRFGLSRQRVHQIIERAK